MNWIEHIRGGTVAWQTARFQWYGLWLAIGADESTHYAMRLRDALAGDGETGFGCMDHRHDAAMYRHSQCQLAGRDTLADELARELEGTY